MGGHGRSRRRNRAALGGGYGLLPLPRPPADRPRKRDRIKVSEVFTGVSVLIALAGFLLTWWKDRQTAQHAQADRIRSVAARSLTKLDRWKSLAASFYDEDDACFEEAKRLAIQGGADDGELRGAVRNRLWTALSEKHCALLRRYLEEEIPTAYVGIIPFMPRLRTEYVLTVNRLMALDRANYVALRRAADRIVMKSGGQPLDLIDWIVMESGGQPLNPINMYNDLTRSNQYLRARLLGQADRISQTTVDRLIRVIGEPDAKLTDPDFEKDFYDLATAAKANP